MCKEKSSYSIHGLQVLEDNIIWIWSRGSEAVIIDPSVTEPVAKWLESKELKLISIIQTHHHNDHIGGTKGLLNYWPKANIIASKADIKRIPFQTISVSHGDEFSLMGSTVKVLEVAGHTNAHLAYYISFNNPLISRPALFCGDTLFGAGCGRLFEGTAQEMYKSLNYLKALPDETEVYCAHEYTEANLRWAVSIFPEDMPIQKRLRNTIKMRAEGLLSLPSTIREEKETNLFFRAKNVEEFTRLRSNKDNW